MILAAALVVGASFTLLLYKSLFQLYREMDSRQRRLLFTRVLPIFLAVAAVMIGGAIAGEATGHGAFIGVLVTEALAMCVAVPLLVILPFVEAWRGSRTKDEETH